eukprot:CAMPEP_0175916880 /NCGR_PEP_ID=MMETSP0108-20121206/11074_1 /TAXON_ID=195067 ORGANISM="Goniomonas pacifica, Strain CCMP1869" /NCGR_SAMPLE_ID=MMETSP0108 /ASSEMBLY_ACC=CAM_ASM_000204 /LENGTH=84 /DNA_ID=CAMNT_0017239445 /DNA_START=775 /DNA_END=1029 /DNA_ORIENTATION=+
MRCAADHEVPWKKRRFWVLGWKSTSDMMSSLANRGWFSRIGSQWRRVSCLMLCRASTSFMSVHAPDSMCWNMDDGARNSLPQSG